METSTMTTLETSPTPADVLGPSRPDAGRPRAVGPMLGALLALGLGGCTQLEKIEDGGGEAQVPTRVQEAFDNACALAGCHSSNGPQAGLDLTASASPAIIGGASTQSSLPLVELGNVEGSYLAVKILPEPPDGVVRQGDRMPPGSTTATDDIAIILGWIAGAELPGGGGGGGSTTGDVETGSTGADPVVLCGVEDLVPGNGSPFDAGPDAGQIPADIGMVLEANCGCHEVPTGGLMFPYTGDLHFSTLAEIQGNGPSGTPVATTMRERVAPDALSPMPPAYYCNLGDGTQMPAADRDLLVSWLDAGTPDAANWP